MHNSKKSSIFAANLEDYPRMMKIKPVILFLFLLASTGILFAQHGTCGAKGDSVTWTLQNDTLTISGIGKMKDYGIFTTPWGDAYGSITTVVIHPGVTNVGEGICRNCFKLTSVTIPNTVTSIGAVAFAACYKLTSVTIPKGVTFIGSSAFARCISLPSLTIPDSVTTVKHKAFEYVPNIVYSGKAEGAPWYARSMNGYVEDNLVYRDSTKTELLACPATAQGDIYIPKSVTCLGTYAFAACRWLTSVTCYAENPPTLGGEVFEGISKDVILYVPANAVKAYKANENWKNSFADILAIQEK